MIFLFTISFNSDLEAHPEQTVSNFTTNTPTDTSQADFMSSPRYMSRRGSKSLPASPLGSPKSMRKAQPNPYFTGAVDQRAPPTTGGWFLSSLLGIQRDVATSTSSVVSNISEEAEEAIDVTAGSSVASAAAGTNSNNSAAANFMNAKVLKAKPSELREMNFWSPTSM